MTSTLEVHRSAAAISVVLAGPGRAVPSFTPVESQVFNGATRRSPRAGAAAVEAAITFERKDTL